MNESNEEQFQSISEKFKDIEKKISEERKLKYPSPFRLKNSALEIIQILKNTNINDNEFNNWKSWRITNLGLFIVDLNSKLNHDYKKQLKRYYAKWVKEMDKIRKLFADYNKKFRVKY